MQFDSKIDLGQVLVAVGLAGSVAFWAVNSASTAKVAADAAKQASDSVAALRSDMNDQFRGVKTDTADQLRQVQANTNDQFNRVRADIANLPDVRAELTQIERRLDQNDSRADAQSKRVETLERAVIQTRADLDALIRGAKK